MQCPQNPESWQQYLEQGDPAMLRHLSLCAACRHEVERAARVPEVLSQLPEIEAPESLTARFQVLAQVTSGRQFTCADTLSVLEAWRDGDLDAPQSFLVAEHLLWCAACAEVLAHAEALTTALRAIPALSPPAVIAERIAAARLPWWQRMLQPISPVWNRLAPASVGIFAAAALLLACILNAPLAPPVTGVPSLPPLQPAGLIARVPANISPMPGVSTILQPTLTVVATSIPRLFAEVSPARNIAEDNGSRAQRASTNTPSRRQKNTDMASVPTPYYVPDSSLPKEYPYPAPVADTTGGQVPDMDHSAATPATPAEYASTYSAHDAIVRKAQENELAAGEEAQSIAPDTGNFAMLPPDESKGITSTPVQRVELPTKPNAAINAMLAEQLSKAHKNTAAGPQPVTCVASGVGKSNPYIHLYPVDQSPMMAAK